jgi:uncharacterized protein
VDPGHEQEFDEWFGRYLESEKRTTGYLGTTIIAPSGGSDSSVRYVITRFTDSSSLEAWKRSSERDMLVEEVRKYSAPHYQKATGLETWFSLAGVGATPKRWKMSVVTFFAAYIISAITFMVLHPIIVVLPFLLSNVLITGVLVVALTYFTMPGLARLLRRWLYPDW